MEMLSMKNGKLAVRILVPILIGLLSALILVHVVPQTKFVKESLESLDRNNNTVMDFAGTTMTMSLALSAFPDDFASPLANTLSDMDKYFVFILVALFLERLLVVEGIRLSLLYIVPAACGFHVLSTVLRSDLIRGFSYRIAVLGLAVILAVPCSTHLADTVGAEYLRYVDQTIEEANAGAEKVNEVEASEGGGGTIFEKLSDSFTTAVRGVNDLMTYFKNSIKRCVNSVAIMIVTNFVIPLLTFLFFERLLSGLFRISVPFPRFRGRGPKEESEEE